MRFSKLKLVPLAVSLALGVGVASKAQAEAYALAYDNIYNGSISVLVNGAFPGVANPFLNFATPQNSSGAFATLNGVGPTNSDVGTGLRDAAIAVAPGGTIAAPANNAFTPLGRSATGTYSYGDSQVISEQSASGSTTQAANIAESNVIKGTGTGGGQVASGTLLTVNLNVGASCGDVGTTCQVAISFNADPYLKVFLDTLAPSGQASAALRAVATLRSNSTGLAVFNWTPDGAAGGVTGGTEFADSFSLNTDLLLVAGQAAPIVYDPTGDASFGAGTPAGGSYLAVSNGLAPGGYTLQLRIEELTEVARIPEPASLALLGLGLTGLGFSTRRSKKNV